MSRVTEGLVYIRGRWVMDKSKNQEKDRINKGGGVRISGSDNRSSPRDHLEKKWTLEARLRMTTNPKQKERIRGQIAELDKIILKSGGSRGP